MVYNLVGRMYPTKYVPWMKHIAQEANSFRNFDLEDVNVEGAERIADAVAKYDIDRFIHVSSYNADLKSSSEFFRTKVGAPLLGNKDQSVKLSFRHGVRLLFAAYSQRPRLSDLRPCSGSKTACYTNWLV